MVGASSPGAAALGLPPSIKPGSEPGSKRSSTLAVGDGGAEEGFPVFVDSCCAGAAVPPAGSTGTRGDFESCRGARASSSVGSCEIDDEERSFAPLPLRCARPSVSASPNSRLEPDHPSLEDRSGDFGPLPEHVWDR